MGKENKNVRSVRCVWLKVDLLFAQLLHRRVSSRSRCRRLREEALLYELLLIPAHRGFFSHDHRNEGRELILMHFYSTS